MSCLVHGLAIIPIFPVPHSRPSRQHDMNELEMNKKWIELINDVMSKAAHSGMADAYDELAKKYDEFAKSCDAWAKKYADLAAEARTHAATHRAQAQD